MSPRESSDTLSITQVSTADVAGGAEKVATDLHREYLRRGLDASLVVGFKFDDIPRTVVLPNDAMRGPWARAWIRLAPQVPAKPARLSPGAVRLRRGLKAVAEPLRALRVMRGLDDRDFPATKRIPTLTEHAPDIVHLHNLHGGYFDLRALPELCEAQPVVITAHDMWLATGHCAYFVDCDRWEHGCGDCPHLDYPPAAVADSTRTNQAAKRAIFERRETAVHLVAPSRWSLDVLERSILAPAILSTHVIPNGVDQDVFRPGPRAEARSALGIAAEARVVAFTVAGEGSPYKDFETVAACVRQVAEEWREPARPLVLLVIGSANPALGPMPDGVIVRAVPFTPDPAMVARYLHAADVYLHAARAEALGLAILEAQSCGVPAIVTCTGGAPETLRDGETGFVVPERDPEAMAAALMQLLEHDALRAHMASAAATWAAGRFSLVRMADMYLELYAAVTGGKTRRQ